MTKPKLSKKTIIPYRETMAYFQKKYDIPEKAITTDNGSFDLSYGQVLSERDSNYRGFDNQFLEEVVPKEIKEKFHFLSPEILKIIFAKDDNKYRARAASISDLGEKAWIEAYIAIINNGEEVYNSLKKDHKYYLLKYMLKGAFESAVMALYKVQDYHGSSKKWEPCPYQWDY